MDDNKDLQATEVKNPSAAIEAILFAAGYPMKYEKLAEVLSLTPSEVKRLVSELSEKYSPFKGRDSNNRSHHSFRVSKAYRKGLRT